jgi:hypothetical protein
MLLIFLIKMAVNYDVYLIHYFYLSYGYIGWSQKSWVEEEIWPTGQMHRVTWIAPTQTNMEKRDFLSLIQHK